jgi:hypothetical protein
VYLGFEERMIMPFFWRRCFFTTAWPLIAVGTMWPGWDSFT